MKTILKKLHEAYPESSSLKNFFWEAFGVGFFVFLFLYLFRPFGLQSETEGVLISCIIFGLITFGITFLFELIVRYGLKIKKDLPSWTLGKWILNTILLISTIALANYLYLAFRYPDGPFHVGNLLASFVSTFAIGIFPVVFGGLMNQLRNAKRNSLQAKGIVLPQEEEQNRQKIVLPSANKGQSFEVEQDKLLYLESMQNYVLVHYLSEEGQGKEILRSTLSQLELELSAEDFYRTHRSFIVNLNQIEKVEGNAQGLKLFLKSNVEESIPVSRKKIKELKNRLSQKLVVHP